MVRIATGPFGGDQPGRQAGECSKRSPLLQDPWEEINLADKLESMGRGYT